MWIKTAEGLVNLERFESIKPEHMQDSMVLVLYAEGTDALYIKCSSPEQAETWMQRIADALKTGQQLVELR